MESFLWLCLIQRLDSIYRSLIQSGIVGQFDGLVRIQAVEKGHYTLTDVLTREWAEKILF